MEKKRRYLMQPNFQSLYTLQRVAALYVMCAIVQCCWSEGLPNARQTNFGVGSIKKKNSADAVIITIEEWEDHLVEQLFTK